MGSRHAIAKLRPPTLTTDASFILLVPFNLFGFAQATTSALTLLLPAYKACVVLERDGPTDNLLAYFVILGYFQMLETFVLRLLVSQIRKSAAAASQLRNGDPPPEPHSYPTPGAFS